MISLRTLLYYCSEDISLIENYEKAINDKQMWDCHHRRETDEGLSIEQLKELGLYYGRPANELIFLTPSEHMSLHHKNKYVSEETRKKQSESNKGKHHTEETRSKQSELKKGDKNPNYGKPSTIKGRHRVYHEDGTFHMEK